MVVATAQRLVHAPAEAVFAIATDPDRMREWQPSLRRVRRLDRGAVGVGSQLAGERLVAGVAVPFVSEVTRWQPPHWYAFEVSGRGVVLWGEQRVTPLDPDRCLVTARLQLDRAPAGLGWFRDRLGWRIEEALDAELQSLAALVEGKADR